MKLLHNARVYTLDSDQPVATALAIDAGRIVAVGGDELLLEFGHASPENLGGRVVLPGLVDAHIHLEQYAMSLHVVDCELPSRQDLLQRVAKRALETPAGDWVRGHGWNQNDWGGSWPTAVELDAVTPHNPAFLTAKSLHAGWANSAALKLAGMDASTPDPLNGRLLRDPSGFPTGILMESAVRLVESAIPKPTPQALALIFQKLFLKLWSFGLTGVHDFDKRTCFMALQLLQAQGQLRMRVLKSIPLEALPQAVELGLHTGFGDDFLRIGSVKLFADGALGPHTAAMFDPYVDEPQNRGILILNGGKVFEYGCQAAEANLSLAVHAIGDRAVHEVLDGFARLREYERSRGLPALRHRIEHVQTIRADDARRLDEYGLIASMQPVHAPSDMLVADRLLGERAIYSHAWRTQLESGARLAFGSDAPVESPNPFQGLHAAITRCRVDGSPGVNGWIPEQRLALTSALAGFTTGPAFAAGMEDRLGRLSAGFLADLIVVDADPFTCEPAGLHTIRPLATMIAGDWVWRS